MNELTSQGVSSLWFHLNCQDSQQSDRILVMHEGTVAGIVENDNVSSEEIMLLATRAYDECEYRKRWIKVETRRIF